MSIWWLVLAGILAAPLGGKFFCRWLCPAGCMVEFGLDRYRGSERSKLDLMYFKTGCPVAWLGGWMNRISLLTIRRDAGCCTHCNACDRTCYIALNDPNVSLHQPEARYSPHQFQCSRCGACIKACPQQALAIGMNRMIR